MVHDARFRWHGKRSRRNEQIGEKKSMSKFEIRELIDKFVKANYYTPEVVKTEKEAYYNNNTNKF